MSAAKSVRSFSVVVVLLSGCAGGLWQKPNTLDNADGIDKTATSSKNKMAASAEKEAGTFSQRLAQGHSLETSGKPDEARTLYEKLIVDFPDRYESYHRLAVVADRQRRHREAQSLYLEALKRKPNDAQILNDLGYCFFLQGQLDKAESATSKAVALAPSNCRFRNNLGLIYGNEGRTDEALEAFRHAGSEADAQYNMAFVLASQNDLEGAKERFRMALTADPTYSAARKALKSFEKADSDPELLADNDDDHDNVRMVPYVESGSKKAAAEAEVASDAGSGTSTHGKTSALQVQARELMAQRLSERSN